MTKKAGRPVVVGPGREIKAVIPHELADALDQFVQLTGEARTSVIRRGVSAVLAESGAWDPARASRMPVVPTKSQKEHS